MGMEGAANWSWMSRAAHRDGSFSRVLWYEPALLRQPLEDPIRHLGMQKDGCALASSGMRGETQCDIAKGNRA
jgi:hypothetical protein